MSPIDSAALAFSCSVTRSGGCAVRPPQPASTSRKIKPGIQDRIMGASLASSMVVEKFLYAGNARPPGWPSRKVAGELYPRAGGIVLAARLYAQTQDVDC